MSGPSQFCPSATFSVNVSDETNVTWTVSPSNTGTFSQNGPSTTFTKSGSFTGGATISAALNGPCGNTTLTKQVTIFGSISMSWTGTGPYGQVDVTVYGGSSPYRFYRNGSLIHTSSTSTTTVPFGCNGGVLKAEASTPCRVASDSDIIPAGCASYSYQIFPNPSSNEIFVEKNDDNSSQSSTENLDSKSDYGKLVLELYDFNGNRVRNITYKSDDLKKKIDVLDLKKGIYFLHITDKDMQEIHRIIIE